MPYAYRRKPVAGNRWLHCSFCHRVPVDGYQMLVNDRNEGPLPVKLCLEHLWILRQAGNTGRVHAATGIRWWLAEDRHTRPQ